MEIDGHRWKSMEIDGNRWKSMKIDDNRLKIYEKRRKTINNNDNRSTIILNK